MTVMVSETGAEAGGSGPEKWGEQVRGDVGPPFPSDPLPSFSPIQKDLKRRPESVKWSKSILR